MRGDGRIFKRMKSKNWYIGFYGPRKDGSWDEIVLSSRSPVERVAREFLRRSRRAAENHRAGIKPFVATYRLTFNKIADDMLAEMRLRGLKSSRTARTQIEHAREHFGDAQARSLTASRLREYQSARLKEGAKRATVDREVELVLRAMRLAHEEDKIGQVPRVSKLLSRHGNARKGFVKPEEFDKILGFIDDGDFRDWLEFFWWTAMRDGEISSLTWGGFHDGTPPLLTLFGENAKTGEPRQIPVVGPLEPIIARRLRLRVEGCDRIFHSNGKSLSKRFGGLRDWCYQEWRVACQKVGLPNLRVYDLRRSAIRNLIHAGIPQATTMRISGHRTAETFRRYLIEDAEDIANAFRTVERYVRARQNGQGGSTPDTDNSPTPEPKPS